MMSQMKVMLSGVTKLKALFFHDGVTGGVAFASILSPAWLPYVSNLAALIAPVLGVIWLIVQIYAKIREIQK
jgi:hypothetical protein